MLAAPDGTTTIVGDAQPRVEPDAELTLDSHVPVAGGGVGSAVGDVRAAVADVLLRGGRTVVVDVDGLDRLPSPLLSALLWAHRRCAARGGAVVLRNPHRDALDQLRRTGLDRVFRVELRTGAR